MGRVRTNGKAERKKAAELRQKEYDSLSPQEKLDRLPKEGAKKQRKKLEYLVRFGRNMNQSSTPSKTQKGKHTKLSRKERWEEKQKKQSQGLDNWIFLPIIRY